MPFPDIANKTMLFGTFLYMWRSDLSVPQAGAASRPSLQLEHESNTQKQNIKKISPCVGKLNHKNVKRAIYKQKKETKRRLTLLTYL